MKTVEKYAKEWEQNASVDPYWAVLSSSKHQSGAWNREEFFATGVQEIKLLRQYITQNRLPVEFTGTALDFGCGVGRLSLALSPCFHKVIAVDIAQGMLDEAQASCDKQNIEFIHNPKSDLSVISDNSIDFIYSSIVLQHIGRQQQISYIKEFGRILKPGGSLIMQIPSMFLCSRLKSFRRFLGRQVPYPIKRFILRWLLGNRDLAVEKYVFEVNSLEETVVRSLLKEKGVDVVHQIFSNSCEPDFCGCLEFLDLEEAKKRGGYLSPIYFAKKG
ncbi:MAG: 2-methoxy-6-polyprenyl-1,4-benzoquinol methylase, mitochondrial [Chlamydiales bacterium]|nr:2-methoxy-6-polyprenyl-1,4-benzoquinol methylase, mitochondrial [Chlamydiales bacterium]MCH9635979.1 2-methoxy-6-polyprenyl-1,4-benzoquinol methylase, mitochondrial [Chlamydiales bacterium]MCH9703684.1 class I SAM-dependent methyltransferase [Chlamydiota bacterium]